MMKKEKKEISKQKTPFIIDKHIYSLSDLKSILEELDKDNFKYYNHKKYLNYPISFDIETTSFYEREGVCLNTKEFYKTIKEPKEQLKWSKRAIMYAFVFGINGKCIIGRNWNEFLTIYNELVEYFDLDPKKRVAFIYIHNLSFEFQFIRKYFDFVNVFSISEREPLKALTTEGVEFRCSLKLSGYSLEKVGENLHKYKVEKMVGDLNYYKLRNEITPLTKKELGYILNDGLVVMAYIEEEIEEHEGNIGKIELTKTGKVRTFCRNKCLYHDIKRHRDYKAVEQYKKFHKIISKLSLSEDDYLQLKRSFHGGFTHANHNHVGEILKDVSSHDFSSAYPSVIFLSYFPMSSFQKVEVKTMKDLRRYLDHYACLFEVVVEDLESKIDFEHVLSGSKCYILDNPITDNGRIVSAKKVALTMNEIDFKLFASSYKWSKITFHNFKIAYKGKLPREFIVSLLELYKNKTTLKGVDGKEIEYLKSKEFINSLFGMCVTDICRDEIVYKDGEWTKELVDIKKAIEKYNNDTRRFLFYAWGVWITSINQANLFKAIFHLKNDYIYSDTDSVKYLNYEKHKKFFEEYNKDIKDKLIRTCEFYNLDFSLCSPKTIKGVEKTLGYFDFEGTYPLFKTLGAKRYIYQKDDHLVLTCAGLNKDKGINYLLSKYKDFENVLYNFDKGLYIPRSHTGKLTHTYIDEEIDGTLTDYKGNRYPYHELSFVHLEECDYSLDIAKEFIDYLLGGYDEEIG